MRAKTRMNRYGRGLELRRILMLACLVVCGCLSTPVTAPAPIAFHASRSAREATQVAAVALANAGFRVAQTDSIGQLLSATRTATHNGNEDYITCQLPRGSGAAANRQTILSITFRAKPSTSGSDVTIDGKVTTSYPGYEGTAMQTARTGVTHADSRRGRNCGPGFDSSRSLRLASSARRGDIGAGAHARRP